jgi:hypothetical protein
MNMKEPVLLAIHGQSTNLLIGLHRTRKSYPFVDWAADVTLPESDQALACWNQGVHDARWLTYEKEYRSLGGIAERMGCEYEFILFEISEGVLPATAMAEKVAISAPAARDWYARPQQTQNDSYETTMGSMAKTPAPRMRRKASLPLV